MDNLPKVHKFKRPLTQRVSTRATFLLIHPVRRVNSLVVTRNVLTQYYALECKL
jgi:hypothetical protein